jgi:hypothetical protein
MENMWAFIGLFRLCCQIRQSIGRGAVATTDAGIGQLPEQKRNRKFVKKNRASLPFSSLDDK